MRELAKLPNIGQAITRQLEQVGVDSVQAIRQLSAREAWLQIQAMDDSACIHHLITLEDVINEVKKPCFRRM